MFDVPAEVPLVVQARNGVDKAGVNGHGAAQRQADAMADHRQAVAFEYGDGGAGELEARSRLGAEVIPEAIWDHL